MKALIDGDILLYSIGSLKDEATGEFLSWPLTLARLDGKIKQIVREAGADSYVIYVSGPDNYRIPYATIKPYKGHRPEEKPHHYNNIKNYFKGTKNHEVIFTDGIEADDAMGIEQSRNIIMNGYYESSTIICTRDKDLDMIPGWHYKWHHGDEKKKEPYIVTQEEGMKWFFKQLLTGDSADNILGLFGIGDKKADKMLDDAETQDTQGWYNKVHKEYSRRFGSYAMAFILETAILLWILRGNHDINCPEDEAEDLIYGLEDKRETQLIKEGKF
jgi:DNA polymerase-1